MSAEITYYGQWNGKFGRIRMENQRALIVPLPRMVMPAEALSTNCGSSLGARHSSGASCSCGPRASTHAASCLARVALESPCVAARCVAGTLRGSALNAPGFDFSTFQWAEVLRVGIGAGVAYLGKNLLTTQTAGSWAPYEPARGSGTTAAVAHGRQYLGIELNPEYIALAQKDLRACNCHLRPDKSHNAYSTAQHGPLSLRDDQFEVAVRLCRLQNFCMRIETSG